MKAQLESLREVSVAILSCNRREDLRQTLTWLLDDVAPWREIVVADNVSTDGTLEMLRNEFPSVRVMALERNEGVAGLNKALLSCSGKWILSLDDDSCPVLETWGELNGILKQGCDFDTITCSVRSSRKEIGESSASGISPYLGLHQAGSLVRRDLMQDLGGYDASLFLWGVELDFSARALLRGARLGKCDSAIVEHRCTPANRSSERHAFYYTRNLLTFLKRYAPIESRQSLLSEYLANVLVYSVLHRSTVYWQGVRASRKWRVDTRTALPAEVFNQMAPDLRLPFSFLG